MSCTTRLDLNHSVLNQPGTAFCRMLWKWEMSQKITKIIEYLENKVCGEKSSSSASVEVGDCVEKMIGSSRVTSPEGPVRKIGSSGQKKGTFFSSAIYTE